MSVCHTLVCLDCKVFVPLDKVISRNYGFPYRNDCYKEKSEAAFWRRLHCEYFQILIKFLMDHTNHRVGIFSDHYFSNYYGRFDLLDPDMSPTGEYYKIGADNAEGYVEIKYQLDKFGRAVLVESNK